MSKPTPARSDSRRAQLRAAQIQQAKREKNKRIAIIAVVSAVVIAVVITGALLFNRFRQAEAANLPPHATPAGDGIVANPGRAQDGAPTVELFLDYQCPACAQFEQNYGPALEQMAEAGDINLVFRTMTFLDANLGNDSSTRAANAAACSDLTGRYVQYHNALFAHQPSNEGLGYTDENLTQDFPAQAGITGAELQEFTTCYADRTFRGFVNQVDDEAGRSGVTGTPSLHVNGSDADLTQLTDANSLRMLIESLA